MAHASLLDQPVVVHTRPAIEMDISVVKSPLSLIRRPTRFNLLTIQRPIGLFAKRPRLMVSQAIRGFRKWCRQGGSGGFGRGTATAAPWDFWRPDQNIPASQIECECVSRSALFE